MPNNKNEAQRPAGGTPNKLQAALFGTPARRTLTLAGLSVACIICGLMIGKVIVENFGTRETTDMFKGVTYASVAFLWKLPADLWLVIWKFLRWNENRQALTKPLGQLAIAVTGVGLATGYATTEGPSRDPTLIIASTVVVADETVGMDTKRIMLPYFSTRPDKDDQSRSNCDAYTSELAKLDETGKDAVRTLTCGLRSCSTAAKPVEVDVRGFASSRLVDCEGRLSDTLNLDIAEKRREEVLGILNATPSPSCTLAADSVPIKVKFSERKTRWEGHMKDMERFRDLVDLRSGDSADVDPSREILTRRVDVVIESPGGCKVEGSEATPTRLASLPPQ
jgi:hypothetical protein